MSDFEDMGSFWECWASPGKRKRKKPKKNKKSPKKNNNSTLKTDKDIKKKKEKKNSKLKETLKGKTDKLIGKKKKKNTSAVELDDSCVVTQSSKPAVERSTLNPLSNDRLQHDELTEELKKKVRRKKQVAFDLTPGYLGVKRPTFSRPSQQPPKESLFLENQSVRDGERCSQVTVTEPSHAQTLCNDSQCTSDDINSQDLFITQKTFRAPPSLPSSDEAIDKAITTPPAAAQMEQHHDNSFKCSQDSHFHQRHGESAERVQKPTAERLLLPGEKGENRMIRKEQTQKQGKVEPCPVHTKPRAVSPYLAEPIIVLPSPELPKSKNSSLSSSRLSPTCLQPPKTSLTSTSTQTENFFTTELSSFLKFGQKVREAVHSEDLEPWDLSLPFRARRNQGKIFSVSKEVKSDNNKHVHPSRSSDVKEVLKEPTGQCCSVSLQVKSERSVSSQSESDNKSADTTISSEDGESSCRASKLDLIQARAVQMRLNESFFFKTKGEGHSPRPETPLMNLALSRRQVKSKKGR